MKRLVTNPIDGGVAYVNMDFGDVLQNQHLKAYSSILDNLNDVPLSSSEMNRGIILSGLEVLSYDDFTTTLSLTNSVIYIPGVTGYGDFYEPSPNIVGSDITVLTPLFYLTTESTAEKRFLKSGQEETIIEKKYFNITTETPSGPHIKFLNGGTSRRYSRILRYKLATKKQIFITSNLDDFDTNTGIGINEMFGFALCNGKQDEDEQPFFDTRGRYVLGFDNNPAIGNVTDEDISAHWEVNLSTAGGSYDPNKTNYGKIGNKGGGIRFDITGGTKLLPLGFVGVFNIPSHRHGNMTSGTNQIGHRHPFDTGDEYTAPNGGTSRYGRGSSYNYSYNPPVFSDSAYYPTQDVLDDGDLLGHLHNVYQNGVVDSFHDSRPPYMVLAYYQKIDITYT